MVSLHGSRLAAALLLLLGAPFLAAAMTDKGVLYLDDLTFDKIVTGRDDVLVRFDKEYPWGDAHDMFKELASSLGSADAPLLVAGVPISNRDEYLVNPRLSRRFALDKLKDDDFPRFKLFLKGGDPKKPIEYSGGMKKGELSGWIVAHTSIFIGSRGQIEELDAAAKKFMAAKPKDRPAALKAAQAEAAKLELGPSQKEYAEYYIKAMQRVTDKGDSWPAQESERLSKMASDKSVVAAKREVFEWKVNVLASFLPAKAKAGKTADKKTEL